MRYAILFSGMTQRRHLNGLEFCYRTLLDRRGFEPCNVFVFSYDGSLRTADGRTGDPSSEPWPGDGSGFRMKVSGPGTPRALQRVLVRLEQQLEPADEIFIHTSGHGGNHGDGRGPQLVVYPHWQRYQSREFYVDLARLPRHRALVVMMSQCYSGGFGEGVLAASRAESTCFVAAASALTSSHAMADDNHWDGFSRHWIAAWGGYDVDGSPITFAPAACAEAALLAPARQAFDYASAPSCREPLDQPVFATAGSGCPLPPGPGHYAAAAR
ncbi:MAG TPA: C13 family peptidase [Steroidobacteraceae bacterium]|nr:C13 family peptidase [Steroidobacteraceae bacterium]